MKNKSFLGFSLIEVMVGVAVFSLIFVGIYSGVQLVFKVVYQSRLRILETGVLNEQVEIIRNLPFADVGIVNGSPSGVLVRTVTSTRNNIDFLVTRTIRNIDDSFDGLIGGVPNDTAPADYKLVEVEVTCPSCGQREPARLSTYIAPKNLEGNLNHGALFVEVFDSEAEPVQGATVHIVATSTNPQLDMTDVTDNEGMLRIVDLATGTAAYAITVSKDGYTSEQTMLPSVSVPNPVKLPISVAVQIVTEISFSIDLVSSLQIQTLNSVCSALGSVGLSVLGTKVIGIEPDVLKVNQNITTNGSGIYNLTNLEWDNYGLKPSAYDLVGSIPATPINLSAGVDQPVQLILGANTANSLLVQVKDSVTDQPVSGAQVKISKTGYEQTKITGVGYVRQTDWSGGTGQLNMSDESKYWSDDGKLEINSPAGDLKLRELGQSYVSSGYLESSIFDLGTLVNFVDLIFEPLSQPAETGADSLHFQVAVSTTSTPVSWNYLGPDNTSATYYNSTNYSLNNLPNNQRYFRYKVFLQTVDNNYTPILSDLNITYITACTPPGQTYFGNLLAETYTVEVSANGYQTTTQTVTLSGDVIMGIELAAS
ncbi:MAG: hypothetical protein US42_C0008G0053 [Candidatus Magasanikbacteria bacterium GW2011_GWC2_37_14]|uniref:Carboxypeptidase regulatory-like domain-containing protein n=1 Tax=Candidatus Magasanikbacteria bacterium GW2011_GWC2_37_14 TaxID=1619046 RepID=A0A0G0GC33_9BACT|nr:MAG: hypothetical protein US42_C0008G0053 [Candidatus Magasanikbacteria bacterium GW2011_GWC2_37_14]